MVNWTKTSICTGNRNESIRLLQQIADKFNRRALTNFPLDYALYFPTLCGDDNFMYPNLDLFYDDCRAAASVQCGHVLQYRDPYAILRSTTRHRQFNRHILEGIHLYYTTMLSTLHYQLTKYGDTTFRYQNELLIKHHTRKTLYGEDGKLIMHHNSMFDHCDASKKQRHLVLEVLKGLIASPTRPFSSLRPRTKEQASFGDLDIKEEYRGNALLNKDIYSA